MLLTGCGLHGISKIPFFFNWCMTNLCMAAQLDVLKQWLASCETEMLCVYRKASPEDGKQIKIGIV